MEPVLFAVGCGAFDFVTLFQFIIWHSPGEDDKAIDLILFIQSADNYLEEITISSSPSVSPEQWIQYAYSLVCAVFLISFLLALMKIFRIIKTHTVQLFNRIKFINTKEPGAPFSFLQYIFWNDKISLQSETGQQIFQHELVHVREKHTLDKLFMQTVLVFFWCNPFFWLIRRELKFIHEFIADKKAVGTQGTEAFAAMIMQAVYPQHYHTITNQFFQKSIKRRLLMLTKIENPRVAYIRRIVALPLIAIIAFAFTVRTEQLSGERSQKNSSAITVNANDTIPKKKEISRVDVGTSDTLRINEVEIWYNDGRREVLTKGFIKENDQKNEITLSGYSKQKGSAIETNETLKQPGSNLDGALFIVDGKEITKQEMEKTDPSTIESINVLKGKTAMDKYGDKGKNGVVEITLKAKDKDGKIIIKENGKTIGSGEVTVTGYPSKQLTFQGEINTSAEPLKEVVVQGYPISKNQNKTDLKEVVVQGYSIGKIRNAPESNQPVFSESEFPASIDMSEWRKFLEKNLMPIVIELSNKGFPAGNHVTMVQFIVEKDGSLSDVKILKHPGYDLDKKILEIMKESPKWKPAIQNGRVVRSYHTQPITVQISEQNNSENTTKQ